MLFEPNDLIESSKDIIKDVSWSQREHICVCIR